MLCSPLQPPEYLTVPEYEIDDYSEEVTLFEKSSRGLALLKHRKCAWQQATLISYTKSSSICEDIVNLFIKCTAQCQKRSDREDEESAKSSSLVRDNNRDHTKMNDMASPKRTPGGESPLSSMSNSSSFSNRGSIAKQNRGGARSNDHYMVDSAKSLLEKVYTRLTSLNNQHRLKKVDASRHVLETYHDSFLYGVVPNTVKIRAALRAGFVGHVWHVLEFLLASLSGVFYVYSTYNVHPAHDWVSQAQNVMSVLFVIDYILRVYSEPVRIYYIFSLWGAVDLLSALPVIFLFKKRLKGGSVLHLLQFLRIIRIISLMRKIGIAGSTVAQQILLLSVSTFGAVFLVAGLIQFVEYSGAPQYKQDQCPQEGCINFWDAFYFIIVTISTVGYGDITLKTQLGQLVAILTIIGALIVLPIQIGRITYLASRRPYGGNFKGRKVIDSRYLVISGTISFQGIQESLAEFYNPTHCEDLETYPLRVTILAPFSPSFEVKQIVSLYNGLVRFIEGSPVHQSDLERVCAHRASAFFLLADQEAEDRKVEDAAQIVKALAVHRFCGNRVRIIVEVLEPETQSSAVWDETQSGGIEVICPVKVHYKMMSRNCLIKGLYTFITNLFTSEIKMVDMPEHSFMSEYFHSFDNEVYPLIFPKACYGMLFEEVVEFVFETFNVVLFALDVSVVHKEKGHLVRKVLLHPKGHVIQGDDVGLIIAWDLRTAYAISEYGDKHMQKKKWKKKEDRHGVEVQKYRQGPITVSTDLDGVSGELNPQNIPHSPGNRNSLESQMRSAIIRRYDQRGQEDDDGIELGYGKHGQIAYDRAPSNSDSSDDDGAYPKGMCLEKATERLLAWPPVPPHTQPHASVLERRADLILKNLQERTIPVVELKIPHILVCCQGSWPRHIFYFVKDLRKPDFPNPPIVFLHPNDPSAKQWGKVGIFKDVFFLKGSPIYELDLMRGGILQAEKVMVLADQGTPVDLSGEGLDESVKTRRRPPSAYTSDVDNIVISANIERLVGDKPEIMVVEMQHTIAFHYLRPKFEIHRNQVQKADFRRNRDALVHFKPPFMEGKAVSPMLLGYLMRSSFYNRNTVSIVEQLVEGGYVKQGGCLSVERLRVLEQIPVPEEYANHEYHLLFLGLLHDKGILALGLYRTRGTLGAPTSYVFTNPLKATIVNAGDLVFVLA